MYYTPGEVFSTLYIGCSVLRCQGAKLVRPKMRNEGKKVSQIVDTHYLDTNDLFVAIFAILLVIARILLSPDDVVYQLSAPNDFGVSMSPRISLESWDQSWERLAPLTTQKAISLGQKSSKNIILVPCSRP